MPRATTHGSSEKKSSRILGVLHESLEEEARAELLSEPLLKLEDAWAELIVGGGDLSTNARDTAFDCRELATTNSGLSLSLFPELGNIHTHLAVYQNPPTLSPLAPESGATGRMPSRHCLSATAARRAYITVELEPVLLNQPVGDHAHTNLTSSMSVAREFELILEVGLAGGVDPSHVEPHGSLRAIDTCTLFC